jgi:hypothetical protein
MKASRDNLCGTLEQKVEPEPSFHESASRTSAAGWDTIRHKVMKVVTENAATYAYSTSLSHMRRSSVCVVKSVDL